MILMVYLPTLLVILYLCAESQQLTMTRNPSVPSIHMPRASDHIAWNEIHLLLTSLALLRCVLLHSSPYRASSQICRHRLNNTAPSLCRAIAALKHLLALKKAPMAKDVNAEPRLKSLSDKVQLMYPQNDTLQSSTLYLFVQCKRI